MLEALRAALYKRWLRRRGLKLSVAIHVLPLQGVLELEEGVSIGEVIPRFTYLRIGAMSYVRSGCELANVSSIGRFCSIGNHVVIGQEKAVHPMHWVSSHPFQYTGTAFTYEGRGVPVEIGHDVWVGREAMIMEGVRVGTGAIIAARAVVTRDVPPYAVVAGIPARVVSYRHAPALVTALLDSTWWELPVNLLRDLPLDNPERFLEEVAGLTDRRPASYKRVEVSRDGCRELTNK